MNRWREEWSYPMATFCACCVVLLMNCFTAFWNWQAYAARVQLFSQIADLRQRLSLLEEDKTQHMQPDTKQLLPQEQPRAQQIGTNGPS